MSERTAGSTARGTADMKGFIACVLTMVPIIAERDLPGPIHLAFSHDEEVEGSGVSRMIDVITGGNSDVLRRHRRRAYKYADSQHPQG